MEDPEIPPIADLPLEHDEDQPPRLVGVPQRLPLAVLHQRLVHRLEQRDQALQAVGDRAQRQVQAVRGPVGQEPIGRPVEQILVQEHGHPDRDPQDALGDQPGRRRGGDDAGMGGTRAGRPIAATADDPAMGPDIDLQDDRILGAREVVEGLATPRAAALVGGQELGPRRRPGGGNNRVASDRAGRVAGRAAVVAVASAWDASGAAGVGRRGGLGLSAEELLLAEAEQGLKPLDLGLELGLAFEGAAMHGLPVGGLPPRLELLLQAWANRTGALGKRRSGTDGTEATMRETKPKARADRWRVGPVPRPGPAGE